MGKPFRLMAMCSFRLLSVKTMFLVAIVWVRKISKLQALCHAPLSYFYYYLRVALQPSLELWPKIFLKFYLDQDIHLPVCLPWPQNETINTLDVCRALQFYLDRTRSFRMDDNLFISCSGLNHKFKMDCDLHLIMLPPCVNWWPFVPLCPFHQGTSDLSRNPTKPFSRRGMQDGDLVLCLHFCQALFHGHQYQERWWHSKRQYSKQYLLRSLHLLPRLGKSACYFSHVGLHRYHNAENKVALTCNCCSSNGQLYSHTSLPPAPLWALIIITRLFLGHSSSGREELREGCSVPSGRKIVWKGGNRIAL